jgi:hypothetical protein
MVTYFVTAAVRQFRGRKMAYYGRGLKPAVLSRLNGANVKYALLIVDRERLFARRHGEPVGKVSISRRPINVN